VTALPASPDGPPDITETSALIAWCRRLSDAGAAADPAEVAAYLAAKASLINRIQAARAGQEGDPRDR
jgi:hypothetical protein